MPMILIRFTYLRVRNHVDLKLRNHLTLELGNHVDPELRNHLTLELGNDVNFLAIYLGNKVVADNIINHYYFLPVQQKLEKLFLLIIWV
jgi:hypothetical protein